MSTMVERVARAMCEAADDDWDWSVFYIVDVNDTAETGRDVYRDMARAAIGAMEPTGFIEEAGWQKLRSMLSEDWVSLDQVGEVFTAMIQAALKEQE